MPQVNEVSWFINILMMLLSIFSLSMLISNLKLSFSVNFSNNKFYKKFFFSTIL